MIESKKGFAYGLLDGCRIQGSLPTDLWALYYAPRPMGAVSSLCNDVTHPDFDGTRFCHRPGKMPLPLAFPCALTLHGEIFPFLDYNNVLNYILNKNCTLLLQRPVRLGGWVGIELLVSSLSLCTGSLAPAAQYTSLTAALRPHSFCTDSSPLRNTSTLATLATPSNTSHSSSALSLPLAPKKIP